MTGRRLCSEDEAIAGGFAGSACARRRQVLRETIAAFANANPPDRYQRLAQANLSRWRGAQRTATNARIEVHAGDWGEVTAALTAKHGVCFAALNMANAHVPGGAYAEGAVAQEENMFRRTDCHFSIGVDELDPAHRFYRPAMTRLLDARDGRVYLDVQRPRVCIRAGEDRTRPDLGYGWLDEAQIFPFYELRAAARDRRDGSPFDADDARRRIAAQLETLRAQRIRHVVLGAFGCGAFANPADRVAAIYRDEISRRIACFDVVAFAIFAAGFGPDNFTPFAETFAQAM